LTIRRCLLILTIGALLLALRVPVRADSFLYNLFEQYTDALRRQAGIPGMATAIVTPNGGLFESAYGYQDLERSILTRTDTPFHVDGVTQAFTAELLLQCVEQGRLDIDTAVARFDTTGSDPGATVRQIMTHTSTSPGGLTFSYRLDRLAPLTAVAKDCDKESFRRTLASTLERFAMKDSVPGPDAATMKPEALGVFSKRGIERYQGVMTRLAVPYAVDRKGRPSASEYTVTSLTASAGLISTVDDLAKFDLALRDGLIVRDDMLAASWRNPVSGNGDPLPHAIGWFAQTYNGELIVWQFGVDDNASSSLILKVPARGLTLIMLANSDRLAKPFSLAAGDVTVSPFALQFLRLFVY
jgi:CubicO group peptidase (beta-lactamase class C family)